MKLNLSFFLIICGLCIISCGSDDSSDSEEQSSNCDIEVLNVTNDDTGKFTFTIKNGNSAITGVSVGIKYFQDGVVTGSGIGTSASEIDAGETIEFDTVSADVSSTSDFDCAEYTLSVFTSTNICKVEGPECP